MTTPTAPDYFERLRRAVLDAVSPLVRAMTRLLEQLEGLEATLVRYTLRARYGATVHRDPRGNPYAYTSRRLSAAQAGEVWRLTARLERAERRSNGARRAVA